MSVKTDIVRTNIINSGMILEAGKGIRKEAASESIKNTKPAELHADLVKTRKATSAIPEKPAPGRLVNGSSIRDLPCDTRCICDCRCKGCFNCNCGNCTG